MIRCIPVDGSAPFEVEPAVRAVHRRTEIDACGRGPHRATTCTVVLCDGVVRWPFEVARAQIDVDGATEDVVCLCMEHVIYCAESGLPDGEQEQAYVERPDGTWLACRIESWRERAERLEKERDELASNILALIAKYSKSA